MTNPVGDAELVARAERGDDAAFEQLVERHFETVFNAASIIGNGKEARVCAQEAFREAKVALSKLKDKTKFGLWAFGISRRKAIYILRLRKLSVPTSQDIHEDDPR